MDAARLSLFGFFLYSSNLSALETDFYISVDDYAQFYLDGQHVAGYDGFPWSSISVRRDLSPGWHDIRLEYANRFGSTHFSVWQKRASDPDFTIVPKTSFRYSSASGYSPGLLASYSGTDLSGNQVAFTVEGEGPIYHGWDSLYQGNLSSTWAGVFDSNWGTFSETLTGQILVGAPTFQEVIQDAISYAPSGSRMNATFRPNFGFTLDETAALGGYDHFNWFQVIKLVSPSRSFSTNPEIDPPLGGTEEFGADNLVYYWDESVPTNQANWSTSYLLDFNTLPGGLLFQDNPYAHVSPIGAHDYEIQVHTMLAGVRSDIGWDILGGFRWRSDNVDYRLGSSVACGCIRGRNLDPIDVGGIVYGVEDGISLDGLDVETRRLLIASGALNISPAPVPLPAGSLLLASSLLSLGLVRHWGKRPS